MANSIVRTTVIIFLLLLTSCAETANNGNLKKFDMDTVVETKKLADEAYANEDWEQVVVFNLKLIEFLPAEPEPYFKLGNAYARLNQHGLAEKSYKEALFRDRKNAKVWHNLGVTQIRLAAMTLLEMQSYTDSSDALSVRAKILLNKLSDILGEDFTHAGNMQ